MHLSVAWPPTLKAWDTREDLARRYETDLASNARLYPHPIVRLPDYFERVYSSFL